MSYYVKSLKLTFEREVSEVATDEYGYPMQIWVTRQYSVTVESWSTTDIKWLYREAMDAFHRRYGKLVRVQSIFELVVTKTNIHVRRAKLEDYIVIGENGEEILVL